MEKTHLFTRIALFAGLAVLIVFTIVVIWNWMIMADNLYWEQGWAYIIDSEIDPLSTVGQKIIGGHIAYTAAFQWFGISWLGLVLGTSLTTGAMVARHYQNNIIVSQKSK